MRLKAAVKRSVKPARCSSTFLRVLVVCKKRGLK